MAPDLPGNDLPRAKRGANQGDHSLDPLPLSSGLVSARPRAGAQIAPHPAARHFD